MERYIKIAGGKMRVILCLLVWMLVGAACDSFLDIAPSKKTNIELSKVEHLDALLAAINTTTGNTSLVLSPDITEISTDLYDKTNNGAPFYQHGIAYYLWMNQEVADLSGSGTWSSAYKNIFTANTVLENLSRVTGDEALKADLKAEAHFIRAFQNWELLNTYCLPYSPENMKEPGIPHKTSTSFEQSLVRMNLEESYRFVEEDLKEALKITVDNVNRRWRVSIPAVHSFLARFYLFCHDYDQALKYADLALQADARLVDYSTEMYYGNEQNSSQGPLQVPYLWWEAIYDPSVKLEWAEFYYQYFLSASCAYFCPSREMLKLYDKEDDLRYKYLMCENFSWRHNIKYTYPGYVYFRTSIPYGTTVQEMILTKAECLARQGKFQQAMETVNILRAKRIAPGPEVKLSAATKEEAIAKILEERVRELTWGLRWFDIRRLNYNETTLDDVNLKRIFYSHDGLIVNKESQPIEYRLELKDRRFAEPINSNEIYLSRGQIQQNTY